MGYIEENLNPKEKVIASIKHNKLLIVAGAVLSIIVCGLGVLMMVVFNIVGAIMEDDRPVKEIVKSESLYATYVMLMIVGAFFIILGLLVFISYIAEVKSAQLVLTDKRILGRRGFIAKYTADIFLSKVDTISVNSTFFGAIFGYSTIKILTAGSSSLTRQERLAFTYPGISNSVEFKRAVLNAVEQAKKTEQEEQAAILANSMGTKPQE